LQVTDTSASDTPLQASLLRLTPYGDRSSMADHKTKGCRISGSRQQFLAGTADTEACRQANDEAHWLADFVLPWLV